MGMTAEIMEARRHVLGASETPIVLGFGKYRDSTPDQVYWRKVGPLVENDTDAKQMGNDFEPALVAWAQRKLGVTFMTDPKVCFQVMLDGIGKGILAATPDGIFIDGQTRWGLEGKAVMYGNPGIDQWGEPDTDKVPDDVLIQAQQQAAVWDLEIVWVPVLWCVGFRPEFRMYSVRRDRETFNDGIAPPALGWWNDYILTRTPPGDEPPQMEVIKRLERKRGLYVPADEATSTLIDDWNGKRDMRLCNEKAEQAILREVLARLGEAEGFKLPDGRLFKYEEQNGPRRCDLDKLQQQYAPAYNETVTQPRNRVARLVGKAKTVSA